MRICMGEISTAEPRSLHITNRTCLLGPARSMLSIVLRHPGREIAALGCFLPGSALAGHGIYCISWLLMEVEADMALPLTPEESCLPVRGLSIAKLVSRSKCHKVLIEK